MDLAGFAGNVIHQQVLAESVGSCEVGLAPAHLRDFLNELHQAVIARQHERVNHDSRALALVDFLERLADNEGVQAERVFVDSSVLESAPKACRR